VLRFVSVLVRILVCSATIWVGAGRAVAGDWTATIEPPAPVEPWRELSAGVVATPKSWVAYSSSTFAPFGALAEDGIRLRVGGGYGKYRYNYLTEECVRRARNFNGDCIRDKDRNVTIDGRVSFTDVLAGYQFSTGGFTAKAFAGYVVDTQDVHDPLNLSNGRASGFKGAIETWTNITPTLWLSFDGSKAQAHRVYAAQARLGVRVSSAISIGLEASAFGNIARESDQQRAGIFSRLEWSGGEVTIAGGLGDPRIVVYDTGSRDKGANDNAWAAVNVLLRY
jgi:Cellulose biosynthesis protein BcsS